LGLFPHFAIFITIFITVFDNYLYITFPKYAIKRQKPILPL
jgi:hypothetical protein